MTDPPYPRCLPVNTGRHQSAPILGGRNGKSTGEERKNSGRKPNLPFPVDPATPVRRNVLAPRTLAGHAAAGYLVPNGDTDDQYPAAQDGHPPWRSFAPDEVRLQDGLLGPAVSMFDYGCGHGQDIELLDAQGIACDGWDPVFRPDSPKRPADVVNLGFVLNVIEDVGERDRRSGKHGNSPAFC